MKGRTVLLVVCVLAMAVPGCGKQEAVSHEGLFPAGKVRPVLPTRTEWEFGGGDGRGPNIIDLVVPGGESQEVILSSYRQTGSVAEIPGVTLAK